MERKPKKKIEFTLPWPPSVNAMYTRNFHLQPETKNYYDLCYFEIYQQCGKKIPKFRKKVTMLIEFFPKRNSGWDENNFKKAPEDAIVKAGVIPDDQVKFLKPLESIIHPRVKKPFLKITLEEI